MRFLRAPCRLLIALGLFLVFSGATIGAALMSVAWSGKRAAELPFEHALLEVQSGSGENPAAAAEQLRRHATQAIIALRDGGYAYAIASLDEELHK